MELQATTKLFGLAFVVLFAATVAFLIWTQVSPIARPEASTQPPSPPSEAEEPSGVPPGEPLPAAAAAAAAGVPSSSDIGGRLRNGVHPSAQAGEGQGALELVGSPELRVEVDGVDRGTLPLRLALDEGVHRVRYVRGSSFLDRFYYVKAGATRALEVVTQPGGFIDAR
jgi:hypothetical protein